MFRRIDDFRRTWDYESDATLKIFRALTDPALDRAVVPGGRTLGRLAWHIVGSLREMMEHSGLPIAGPGEEAPQPALAEMIREYERCAKALAETVARQWTDAMLAETVPMYGEQWARGQVLAVLIGHQAHHRGQMTVLMRQAGLRVPGVCGPAAEEWAAMNLPPQP
jgi:uncharacterized damage-inducible protein DinB